MNEAGTTVAAVSTPRGVGGVAVIRISGPDAAGVLYRCFAPGRGGEAADKGANADGNVHVNGASHANVAHTDCAVHDNGSHTNDTAHTDCAVHDDRAAHANDAVHDNGTHTNDAAHTDCAVHDNGTHTNDTAHADCAAHDNGSHTNDTAHDDRAAHDDDAHADSIAHTDDAHANVAHTDCAVHDDRAAHAAYVSARFPDRMAIFGRVLDENGDVVDEALATLFRAPRSFTGEDVAEISCHGGVAVTRDVLDAVFAAGAVPAAPGEFTRRAFLSGKLSLSRAEAVGRVIAASTAEQRRLATKSARGALSRGISAAADGLLRAVSELWAIVDYPDETLDVAREANLESQLHESAERIAALAATYKRGRAIADGVRTVIAGRPNVGKSSLYNALTGSERAIVTSEPGTTRDLLETTVPFGGVTLLLCDTAGVREGAGEAERIGVDRARGAIESAELILAVFDGSSPLTDEDLALAQYIAAQSCDKLALLGKSDLARGMSDADEQKLRAAFGRLIRVSPATGAGLDELEKSVAELFSSVAAADGDAVLFESRQYAAVSRAGALLGEARELLARGGEIDAVGTLAESALTELWSADSRAGDGSTGSSDTYCAVSEAVLDDIFSRFCVGK